MSPRNAVYQLGRQTVLCANRSCAGNRAVDPTEHAGEVDPFEAVSRWERLRIQQLSVRLCLVGGLAPSDCEAIGGLYMTADKPQTGYITGAEYEVMVKHCKTAMEVQELAKRIKPRPHPPWTPEQKAKHEKLVAWGKKVAQELADNLNRNVIARQRSPASPEEEAERSSPSIAEQISSLSGMSEQQQLEWVEERIEKDDADCATQTSHSRSNVLAAEQPSASARREASPAPASAARVEPQMQHPVDEKDSEPTYPEAEGGYTAEGLRREHERKKKALGSTNKD
jgi:hypothetical protein